MTNVDRKLQKRWGKKYKDTRDWPQYNGQLVKRGEYFLDLDWIKGWDNEIKRMNKNKVGHPYEFPTLSFNCSPYGTQKIFLYV